jgi:uncharacterized protein (TIGR03435 family)
MMIAAAGIIAVAGFANAQTKRPRPAFDAASVKLLPKSESGVPSGRRMVGGPGTASPGRITYTSTNLGYLLRRAWGLPDFRMVGPSWMGGFEPAYDVIATMPPETTEQDFKVMLQDLISQRFQMKFHIENRILSGYDLVVAPGGPKLKESADPNAPEPTTGIPGGVDKDGFALLPPGHFVGIVVVNGFRAKFQNHTISEFADGAYLRGWAAEAGKPLAGPIRDKTGLTGKYDFTLAFDNRRPSAGVLSPFAAAPGASEGTTGTTPSGLPDLFGALEKQLGLRLVPVKNVPIDVLIIDKVEKTPLGD